MELRPYQSEAKEAIFQEWDKGVLRTLLVLPTGCGKTIVFAKVTEDCVRRGDRVLILAHRGELLDQAADKMPRLQTGMCHGESGAVLSGQLVPGCGRFRPDSDEGKTAGTVSGRLFQHHHH